MWLSICLDLMSFDLCPEAINVFNMRRTKKQRLNQTLAKSRDTTVLIRARQEVNRKSTKGQKRTEPKGRKTEEEEGFWSFSGRPTPGPVSRPHPDPRLSPALVLIQIPPRPQTQSSSGPDPDLSRPRLSPALVLIQISPRPQTQSSSVLIQTHPDP
ncbi:hypothetical protein WMY93_020875 [Mugilogobius chulae]|uniref:Uncharacterized protein n=1 Tax=Mugilogobius chulae TaxID=88201 RepID=A0AAW0NA93_9GOBI